MSPRADQVAAYYRRLNVSPIEGFKEFRDRLKTNHGARVAKRVIDLTTGDFPPEARELTYRTIAADLRLSIDVITGFSDIHRQYLRWFADQHLNPPVRVLDIGCFNGFLTCYYARQFPKAQIVGIDSLVEPVERARELAKQLRLENVTFEVASIEDYTRANPGMFDLVTAVTVLHEIVGDIESAANPRVWGIQELRDHHQHVRPHPALSAIAVCLTANGQLLSVDRVSGGISMLFWDRLLKVSGLTPHLERSGTIHFHNIFGPERVPVIFATPRQTGEAADTDPLLFILGSLEKEHAPQPATDLWAEVLFDALSPITVDEELEMEYNDGSGVHRAIIARKGDLSVFYQTTNRGMRKLELGSTADMARFRQELEILEDMAWDVADVTSSRADHQGVDRG